MRSASHKKSLTEYCFAFSWFSVIFFSQFYFFPSGTPQPAQILFALILPFLVAWNFNYLKRSLSVVLGFKFLLLFFCYALLVNLAWGVVLQDWVIAFRPSLFWAFGVISFSLLYLGLKRSSVIKNAVAFSCLAGLVFLIISYFLGFGEYRFGSRFNGFFNDPNQMAFWCLCTFATFFYLYEGKSKFFLALMFFVLSILIFVTQSRSALLGLFFCFASLVVSVVSFNERRISVKKAVWSLFMLLFIISLVLYFLQTEYFSIVWNRFSSTDFSQQSDIRGYGRLLEYPNYLLFGSGQGHNYRFGSVHEIHSTWAGLVFYYGVVGFFLFFFFLLKIFLRLELSEKIMFLAPLAYSFSTYGARTPIFWVFLAAAAFAATRSKNSMMLSADR